MKRNKGLEIVYEDSDLIVVNKPGGLLTMATDRGNDVTAYSVLTDYVRRKSPRSRIFIVHRLDRDTSGLLIFAKNPETKHALQDYWNEAVRERIYVALTEGSPDPPEGICVSWLKDNPKSFKVSSCPYDNGGRKAVTHYRQIGAFGDYALVEFELETGRTNQIRVHAAQMGHPIAGDRKYGAATSPIRRLALHARSIVFTHPWTGETLSFDTGIPGEFRLRQCRQER